VRAVERLADHLGLTGEQRRRFVALQRRLFERMGDLQAERRRLDLALRRELVAPDPDRRRIGDLVDRLGEVHAAGQGVTAETILESRALLDGDQQVLYLRFLQRLRAGRRGDTLPNPPARRHPLRE
jgi:hypothetical protein